MNRILFTVIILLNVGNVHAQTTSPELISSCGDTYKTAEYQLDWSIGELMTESYENGENLLTQGLQQGAFTLTSIEKPLFDLYNIRIFPNPTTDFISLTKEKSNLENFEFSVNDLNGKMLEIGEFNESEMKIDFSKYEQGVYFIHILQNKQKIKLVKIVKR